MPFWYCGFVAFACLFGLVLSHVCSLWFALTVGGVLLLWLLFECICFVGLLFGCLGLSFLLGLVLVLLCYKHARFFGVIWCFTSCALFCVLLSVDYVVVFVCLFGLFIWVSCFGLLV